MVNVGIHQAGEREQGRAGLPTFADGCPVRTNINKPMFDYE